MSGPPEPLELYREGLALARRAGIPWEHARQPALLAAIAVVPEPERKSWITVLYETRTVWMRAYARLPTGVNLSAD